MVTISARSLHVTLDKRPILRGVDALFAPGRLTGILGPNGAGKSTLVRALLGLATVDCGSISVDGKAVQAMTPRDRARLIAYLPQGHMLHWPMRVDRVIALGLLPHLGPMSHLSEAHHAMVAETMARTDVAHLADRDATSLSGGERARVMLARALVTGAPALIADEPLAALDPGHQIDVMNLLRAEARSGKTIVAVLHDLHMAARYCDDIVMLNNGMTVAAGVPSDVLTPALLRDVYDIAAHVDHSGDVPIIIPLGR